MVWFDQPVWAHQALLSQSEPIIQPMAVAGTDGAVALRAGPARCGRGEWAAPLHQTSALQASNTALAARPGAPIDKPVASAAKIGGQPAQGRRHRGVPCAICSKALAQTAHTTARANKTSCALRPACAWLSQATPVAVPVPSANKRRREVAVGKEGLWAKNKRRPHHTTTAVTPLASDQVRRWPCCPSHTQPINNTVQRASAWVGTCQSERVDVLDMGVSVQLVGTRCGVNAGVKGNDDAVGIPLVGHGLVWQP